MCTYSRCFFVWNVRYSVCDLIFPDCRRSRGATLLMDEAGHDLEVIDEPAHFFMTGFVIRRAKDRRGVHRRDQRWRVPRIGDELSSPLCDLEIAAEDGLGSSRSQTDDDLRTHPGHLR